VFGAYLAKQQGFFIFTQIRQQLNQGRIPAEQLIDGVIVLAGGLLLLTPGLLTDGVGFMALIPITRNAIKRFLRRKFRQKVHSGEIYTSYTIEE
ncbi:MAG: FxsA family protein, partial [bacterium]|nr:FxsA family protein [bacterium]